MRIGILTSSRADFGIYQPLIDELILDEGLEIEIIAFGTHLSKYHGYTIQNIKNKYQNKIHEITSLVVNDDENSIATSYGMTVLKFADFWNLNTYDSVFCLGDRYEMAAAVQAGIPFGIKFNHIHGGETTLGATDNIYRHQISLASVNHFTSTKEYKNKVIELTESDENVYNVGALSLSGIEEFSPIRREDLLGKFNIEDKPYCLITFHPETNAFDRNKEYAVEMRKALEEISKKINLVITMPNADTMGSLYRKELLNAKENRSKTIFLVENFGKENYFSAMYHSEFMLGNTSSGIIEAASFKKFVVNVGDRQKGRAQSENIINSKFNASEIIKSVDTCIKKREYSGSNIYYKENIAQNIVRILKRI
ncbi:UDP-N-acetylglucosamine 2-epimerase [Tenacibaculum jejuense]|uniref:UDP-N-acetylglucosamine 2-epimerase n=1 Tax=Tenacibaculum jejuense TaxID=584609 RepID=A0A238U8T5_9FLAO|nr:UDP-N-acetylglucosamine 2-epimerase [Tenacibaculum jejuense]SNR14894.1 UDP-N-acetylglucosamine 2-epimerase [Tenacibaculum jejuense]